VGNDVWIRDRKENRCIRNASVQYSALQTRSKPARALTTAAQPLSVVPSACLLSGKRSARRAWRQI
jgi:hypothetical protein